MKYASTKKQLLTMMKDNRKREIVLSPLKRKHASTIDLDPEEEEPITHPFLSQDNSVMVGSHKWMITIYIRCTHKRVLIVRRVNMYWI
jgi:hypothetical protein